MKVAFIGGEHLPYRWRVPCSPMEKQSSLCVI
jgi:hypothetical protein